MEEEFVDIKGYEGSYQINRLGQVKSCERYVKHRNIYKLVTDRILKQHINSCGYLVVRLYKHSGNKTLPVHQLLVKTFKNNYDGKYYSCDHINKNKLDNTIENLRIVSIRDNNNNRLTESIYGVGVSKYNNKFRALIRINNKRIYIGLFISQEQAYSKYLEVKKQIEEIEKVTRSYSFTKIKINGEFFLNFFPF